MSKLPVIRIGTRKSPLALAQAGQVRAKLLEKQPQLAIELVSIMTSGDQFLDRPLADIGGKGLFTKEIEQALLDKSIDIAVHSMKDMQTVLPEGLIIGCMLEREDPRDMLIGEGIVSLAALPKQAIVGTSSLRRASQLLMKRPDLRIVPLRGNVQTRLGKLQQSEMVCTMLAAAGLKRLGLSDIPGVVLSTEEFLPAIAQGAIGIECRADNTLMLELLHPLSDVNTFTAISCERAFLRELDGSCRTPIAGYAEIRGSMILFNGLIIRPDGSAHHRVEIQGKTDNAENLGKDAGKTLLAKAGRNFIH